MKLPPGIVVISLGSNLGDSVAVLRAALGDLRSLAGSDFSTSSLWATSPVDCPPGSPPFVNGIAVFVPREGETPESLLSVLKEIEAKFGRGPKKILNEPRPLDLDIVAFGRANIASSDLTLPHPRAHVRRFVLAPLAEVDPDYVLPGESISVVEMLARLGGDEKVERMPPLELE